MLIMPATICVYEPPTYEFHMKNPSPPPEPPTEPALPPPEIISAATTTAQVMPTPTVAPTAIDGSVAGRMMRRKMSQVDEPIERAAWKYRTSIDWAPPITLMTIVKNAPRKVTNAIESSCVGQKIIDAGTQARGGIGRSTSKTGNVIP